MTDDLLTALRTSLEATAPAPVRIRVGQTWRHKRDQGREVYITRLPRDLEPGRDATYVDVDRNTSRRTQPIKITTLRRDYRLHREAP